MTHMYRFSFVIDMIPVLPHVEIDFCIKTSLLNRDLERQNTSIYNMKYFVICCIDWRRYFVTIDKKQHPPVN